MLRTALLVFAAILTLTGLASMWAGERHAWPLFWWGGALLIAVLFERWRYRDASSSTMNGGGWQKTGERFIDPETGKLTEVLFNPRNGERCYLTVDGE